MIPNILRAIGGIGVYDTISICLFVAVFSGVLFSVTRMKKPFLSKMSSLPLQDQELCDNGDRTHE